MRSIVARLGFAGRRPGASSPSIVRYLFRVLTHAAVVCALVVLIAFFLVRAVPGDPVVSIQGLNSTPEARAAMRHQLHLDQPLPVAFGSYVRDLASRNLGASLVQQGRPVSVIIRDALPVTLSLIAFAVVLSCLVGIPLGLLAGLGPHWGDVGVRMLATLLLAVPAFFLGLILLLVFGLELRILPAGGWGGSVGSSLEFLILPSIALAGFLTPLVIRVVRQATRSNLSAPWVEAAMLRGLSQTRLTFAHILPNSLLPVVTLIGYNIGALLTGAVVVESVFVLPGIGEELLNSINARDYPVIQGIALVSALAVVGSNLAADTLSLILDPRTRRA